MLIRELRRRALQERQAVRAGLFRRKHRRKKRRRRLRSTPFGAFLDDNETLIAQVVAIDYVSFHNGTPVGAVGIAGVASSPGAPARRRGPAPFFDHLFSIARRAGLGAELSVPFSYRYYRKFGYERAVRNRTLTVALPALGGIPRNSGAALLESDDSLPELLALQPLRGATTPALCAGTAKVFPARPIGRRTISTSGATRSGEARGYSSQAERPHAGHSGVGVPLTALRCSVCSALCGCLRDSSTLSASAVWSRLAGRAAHRLRPQRLLRRLRCRDGPRAGRSRLPAPHAGRSGTNALLRITDDTCPKNNGLYRLAFTDGETVVDKCAEGEADEHDRQRLLAACACGRVGGRAGLRRRADGVRQASAGCWFGCSRAVPSTSSNNFEKKYCPNPLTIKRPYDIIKSQ